MGSSRIENIKKELKELVATDIDKFFLEVVQKLDLNEKYLNECLHLEGRHIELKTNYRQNLINYDDYSLQKSRISKSCLLFLDTVSSKEVESFSLKTLSSNKQVYINSLWGGIIQVIINIIIVFIAYVFFKYKVEPFFLLVITVITVAVLQILSNSFIKIITEQTSTPTTSIVKKLGYIFLTPFFLITLLISAPLFAALYVSDEGQQCRYIPTCKEYLIEAIEMYGLLVGFYMGLKRTMRCAPWGSHGYDPVPMKKDFEERKIKNPEKIARFFHHEGEYYKALNYYLIAIQSIPDNILILKNIGLCHQGLDDYQEALKYHLKALDIKNDDILNLYYTAFCYQNLEQYKKALDYYLVVYKLTPDDKEALSNIGYCYFKIGENKESISYLKEIELLANEEKHSTLGWRYFTMGELNIAKIHLEKVVDRENPKKHDLVNLGHVFMCLGFKDKALKLYQKSIREFNETDLFIREMKRDFIYLKAYVKEEEYHNILLSLLDNVLASDKT